MPQSEVMDYRDTESRVEIILDQSLAFVDANASIRVLCQALSLDEHRITFSSRLYQPHTGNRTQTGDEVNQSDVVNICFASFHLISMWILEIFPESFTSWW